MLELKPKKYLSIGWNIYEFTTEEDIVEYYSSVGNNDVPYPVAFGKENIYFMLDTVYVLKTNFPKMDKTMKSDVYSSFHNDQEINEKTNKFKNVKIIHERIW